LNHFLYVILMGIIQGVTEFLPISSTGHMILADDFLKVKDLSPDFVESFLVIVQFGSIISVVVYFWNKINPFVKDKSEFKDRITLWTKIAVGCVPAAVLGLMYDDYITEKLYNSKTVAAMLVLYGVFFFFIGKMNKGNRVKDLKHITYKVALLIGFFQALAMIPGTSRSGATIIGGLVLMLSRPIAAEFSFFLAIPTMFGATLLKILKNGLSFTGYEWSLIGVGSFVAFVVALVVINWFMDYIKSKDFTVFGVYRIILGILILLILR